MLGDGRLVRRPNATHFTENHSDTQRDYLLWKIAHWGPAWVRVEPRPVEKVVRDRRYLSWRFHTVAHASLNGWQELFYESHARGWKRLLPRVVDLVDELALAVWYLDDGCAGWWPDITFGGVPASRDVAWAIFEKFGLRPRWQFVKRHSSGRETGSFHMEREDTAERFLEIVRPHVPECMSCKLSFGYDSGRNNRVKARLDVDTLRALAEEGTPLRRMAKMLGVGGATIDRHLRAHGIEHARLKGNPEHRRRKEVTRS